MGTSADDAARGIMTTDTVRKVATAAVAGSTATVVGIAKGVGMIEPDMATMIAVVLTGCSGGPKTEFLSLGTAPTGGAYTSLPSSW